MTYQEKLAKILRTKTGVILDMEKNMNGITGKKNIIKDIIEENEKRIKMALQIFNLADHNSKKLHKAIINKLKKNDEALYDFFKRPSGETKESLLIPFNYALKLANIKPLFVLKEKRAREILINNPPPKILKTLGYKNANELLKKENLFEVFSALRFVESNKWMHQTFDRAYKNLIPNDFEERKVKLLVLDNKWLKIAGKFIKKKYHNVSHLKELGVLFIIPQKIDVPGEAMRTFSLILHYLHELDFYSNLIKRYSKERDETNFAKKLCALLRGDILENLPRTHSGRKREMNWMIVQQYIAKHNKYDSRLFIPHVNPEAVHWKKAERDLTNLSKEFKELNLDFWEDLDWVGDYFGETLISFDLIDAVMSLVIDKGQVKYLYHHQEALWNKVFRQYMGDENLEKLMIENFDKGFITL